MDKWSQGVAQADIKALQHLLETEARLLGDFVLSSGLHSKYYFNAKPVIIDPEGMEASAKVMLPIIEHSGANSVGGLVIGAVPLALGVSQLAWNKGGCLPAVIVREAHKVHGTRERLAASHRFVSLPVKKVAVVDDVITTGKSVVQAIEGLEEAGCEIACIVTLVTRPEDGGVVAMKKKFGKTPYISIFDCDLEGNLRPLVGTPVLVG